MIRAIDISEEDYNWIMNHDGGNCAITERLYKQVKESLPIPRSVKCKICMHDAPYTFCCKVECNEHEFCNDCTATSKGSKCPFKD